MVAPAGRSIRFMWCRVLVLGFVVVAACGGESRPAALLEHDEAWFGGEWERASELEREAACETLESPQARLMLFERLRGEAVLDGDGNRVGHARSFEAAEALVEWMVDRC